MRFQAFGAELSVQPIMKTQAILLGFTVLCLSSCGQQSTPDNQSGADAKQTPAGSGAVAKDDKAGTFWELVDKSDLKVVTDPWPPKEGAATLKAEVTTNDDDEKFTGTLAYRVVTTKESSAAWQPMSKVREGDDKSVYYESKITLTKGPVYIQFRVHGAGENAYKKEYVDLTDWKIEVK
jgi:hypothetical protein